MFSKLKCLLNLNKEEEKIDPKDIPKDSLKKFKEHYENIIGELNKDIEDIKKMRLSENIRFFVWMIFLDILPYDKTKYWKKILDERRSDYHQLKKKFISDNINNFINCTHGKGSPEYESYKKIIPVQDMAVLELVKIDIDRTFQEMDYFKTPRTKTSLITNLFIFAKTFPDCGYKQGMNEICAVIMYVVFKNYKINNSDLTDNNSIIFLNIHGNNQFLEEDTFMIFSRLMNREIGEFYQYNSPKYRNTYFNSKSLEEKAKLTHDDIQFSNECLLKRRIYEMFYVHVGKFDNILSQFLRVKIDPELFLLRWYLCLFTREFSLDKVILLWDLILGYEYIQFSICKNNYKQHALFIDSIAISMIVLCKNNFNKNDDYTNILDVYLHYPKEIALEDIIEKALKINEILFPNIKF